jgi:AcrR family transcriptional regulator
LTEDQIVQAALKLAGRARLEDVSMRSLAQELGVPVMTIYNYVANKETLLELVTDHVLRPVRVPPPDGGTWEDRLRSVERDVRSAMSQYPGVSFNQRGRIPAEATRLTDGVLAILEEAGFDATSAKLAFATLFTFMIGQLEVDTLDERSVPTTTINSVTNSTNLSRDDVFEFGFGAVLKGLKAVLGHQSDHDG